MFQPEAKFQFVRRYCPPGEGWKVYVDIDASEVGRTGSPRTTPEAIANQKRMESEGEQAREALVRLGVQVGKSRADWFKKNALPLFEGDRDIVAFHPASKVCMVAEVEGQSTGQPEQKLYKAIGQIIMATSFDRPAEWKLKFVLVVHGKEISAHLNRAKSLHVLGVSALSLAVEPEGDRWLFGANLDRV